MIGEDIYNFANMLSKLDIESDKSFLETFFNISSIIRGRYVEDCFNFHLDDIKNELEQVYGCVENKPTDFSILIDMAIMGYLAVKLFDIVNIIAYNYLINYVNDNKLNAKVSYHMIDVISANVTMDVKSQELIDELHSFLERK